MILLLIHSPINVLFTLLILFFFKIVMQLKNCIHSMIRELPKERIARLTENEELGVHEATLKHS